MAGRHQYSKLMFNSCVNIAAQHSQLLLKSAPMSQLSINTGKINKRYIMARRGTGANTIFVKLQLTVNIVVL